ncbi:glycosyltransferase family 2 protein [Treponema porcinum]|uniref:Glycosyltransferase involved in cell wall bisynthesis n=1 Tax=Treponema porcinum TaxID=261392 RepID=A0A1T4MEV9_TREPO|nr:glycosyltransferase family 2 protein [Treponema porcinum]SJZ65443.1 Glycosyltransferase involved in cell wall bisynthesis [Treponema porcinum]
MKIFAIMLVKNEADIVESVIKDAEKWADRIFIMDNGSTDGTWEIVQSLKNDIVVPWKQDFRPYSNGLRADVFNEFRHEASDGDWWCFKLDADEFYYDNPKEFLEKIPRKYSLVAKKSLDYVITAEDLQEYDFSGDFEKDREHIKYLKNTCWSEPRFFRYRKSLKWNFETTSHYPKYAGLLSQEYILVKHYQFRSPKQMQARLDLRNSLSNKKDGICFRHVKETSYKELLADKNECLLDSKIISQGGGYKGIPIRNSLQQPLIKRIFLRIGIALKLF